MRTEVLNFLNKEKLVTLATVDERGKPWICNLFFATDEMLNMFVVSKRKAKHSVQIESNPEVAYTVCSYNKETEMEKIAIQAQGNAELIKDLPTLSKGAKLIFQKFSDWELKPKEMLKKLSELGEYQMYKITPKFIKFWDETLDIKEEQEF